MTSLSSRVLDPQVRISYKAHHTVLRPSGPLEFPFGRRWRGTTSELSVGKTFSRLGKLRGCDRSLNRIYIYLFNVCVCICVYIYMYIWRDIHTYTHAQICINAYTCTYRHIHIHIYIHTYTPVLQKKYKKSTANAERWIPRPSSLALSMCLLLSPYLPLVSREWRNGVQL